jgi:hypothetical protein
MHTSLRCFTGHHLAVPPYWVRVDTLGMDQREQYGMLLCPPACSRWSSCSGGGAMCMTMQCVPQ